MTLSYVGSGQDNARRAAVMHACRVPSGYRDGRADLGVPCVDDARRRQSRQAQAPRTRSSPRGSVSVLAGPFQAPLTATTPLVAPSSTSRPDSDGEAKGASALPRLILYRTCPVAG